MSTLFGISPQSYKDWKKKAVKFSDLENFMENQLYTLSEISYIVGDWLPITIKLVSNRYGTFGLGGYSYKAGDNVDVVKKIGSSFYFGLGGYIGIDSELGNEKMWELVSYAAKYQTKTMAEDIKELILTPEQEAKLKENATTTQMLCIENDIRLAIFSRTLESVKEEQVAEIVDLVYDKKAKDTFTKKQLNNAISKVVESKYAEQTQ